VIADGMNEMLFMLVRDLDHARDAFTMLKLSKLESAGVVAARAWGEQERGIPIAGGLD
jgi:hypothetical protein